MSDIVSEVSGESGLITLHRPRALNALSLGMIRELTRVLLAWRDDPAIARVAIRGQGREGAFGAFCAGGDIRYFHQAAHAGDPSLEDFFTEEYTLNHLIHSYPKPYVAFMDGIVMGGGMGISQGARLRIVTERTRMAMPETNIGLFPDVGGGWFLGRCPGRIGEYLALAGQVIGGEEAVACGLADRCVDSSSLDSLWASFAQAADFEAWQATLPAVASPAAMPGFLAHRAAIERHFAQATVVQIAQSLLSDGSDWALQCEKTLRARSPLMLHVVLEQVRRARKMTLAEDLRMERDLVRHCFDTVHLQRRGASSETVEGIRALAVDKDHAPRWNPARIEEVTREMVAPFFDSPWPAHAHPLRALV
ncbi:MAG: enoyl-CoA hydratase/isomerase family protein [Betaproteobacteria bacterium]|nr:enoyl-CoA hydratase/isomerase family protein [Betaproteobacteria bacterium]